MQLLKTLWDNTYSLLVDNEHLALGALAGITATGVFSTLAPSTTVQAYAGPVLLGWTCLLVVSNLSAAGHHVRCLVVSPVVRQGIRYGRGAQ